MLEYHVVGVKDLTSSKGLTFGGANVISELEKRGKEGWRLSQAYFNSDAKQHVLIFEREAA